MCSGENMEKPPNEPMHGFFGLEVVADEPPELITRGADLPICSGELDSP